MAWAPEFLGLNFALFFVGCKNLLRADQYVNEMQPFIFIPAQAGIQRSVCAARELHPERSEGSGYKKTS
jgi:hypothetical protein